jgi:hypothetical protein
VDERQLAELFRDAADGGPAASFGHADVVAGSHRATLRRRRAIASGAALAMAVLVGSIVIGGGFLRGPDRYAQQGSTAGSSGGGGAALSAPPAQEDRQGQYPPGPLTAPTTTAVDKNGPEANAEQGRTASGKVVPWPGLRDDDARAECGPADRELADALIGEFPATADSVPQPVRDGCPPQARAAALPVSGGLIYAVLGPAAGDGQPNQAERRDDGAVGYAVYTPTGNVLLVLSVPAEPGGTPPYADRTQQAAEAIAQRY